jgi:thiol-disulfide isomerase/thioredoxin
MVSLQIAALAVALTGASDPVLLDFQAPWCAPCRSMEGTIASLERAGYPVRKVDVDRERALADRYRVQTIPCFVLVANGREVGRVTGAVRRHELVELFAKAGIQPGAANQAIARAQSPDPAGTLPAAARGRLTPVSMPVPAGMSAAATPVTPDELINSCVRLKVEDPTGSSYGSGTIVDARQGDALVLTCGHIFRDSQGKGTIKVDMCGPGLPQQLDGRIISFDLQNDLALVAIRPGVAVRVAPVAPQGHTVARGTKVITVGCDHGGPATAIPSHVASINKFVGPPENVQVAGAPVEGRSGGGLFTTDGLVIGVCNAADPADNEGLFAALKSIQQELDEAGLTAIYAARPPAQLAANTAPSAAHNVPAMSQTMPLPAAAAAMLPGPSAGAPIDLDGAEVICVVRPLNNPQATTEIVRLDRASPAFLQQLATDRQAQASRHLTSHDVPATAKPRQQPAANRKLPASGTLWSTSEHGPTKRVWR